MIRTSVKDRARGCWPLIFEAIGIEPGHLKKNTSCPCCGGHDRFHFYNTKGTGSWFCRGCGAGSGVDLVMRYCDLDFRDAAKLIEQYLDGGLITAKPVKPAQCRSKPAADPSLKLRRMWSEAKPTIPGDLVDTYLRSRGVGLDTYPGTISSSSSLRYYDDDATSTFPAMLAMVRDFTGRAVTIHRTYLAQDGTGKALVEKPRKVVCSHGKSPHVRLTPIMPTLGIAEGIETALAAAKLFNVPTWSVLSIYGVETFEPPAGVERLIIFGDHDPNGAGQKAAHELATRLAGQLPVEVRIPDQVDTDWNDVLRARRREAR